MVCFKKVNLVYVNYPSINLALKKSIRKYGITVWAMVAFTLKLIFIRNAIYMLLSAILRLNNMVSPLSLRFDQR